MKNRTKYDRYNEITNAEMTILKLVAKGLSDEEISKVCFIAKSTIKTHRISLYQKLNISNGKKGESYKRVRLALWYLENVEQKVDIHKLSSELDFERSKRKTLQMELQSKEQEIEQVKKFVAGLMFDVDCTNWFERFVVAFEDWKSELGNDRDKYKQALDEIKNYQQRNCETCVFANTQKCNINCQVFVILDIINKAKEQ